MAEMFGRYRLDERLGQGGMGVVYRGWDPVLQRAVAIKMVLASGDMDHDVRERFFREARAAAQLTHKNIVTVYDLGEHEGRPYLAMEFLDGEDLQRRLARTEKMSFWRKVDIAIEMCQGIEFAHTHGVIHRDLKPGNIFITAGGGVKILDFGLARYMSSQLTQSNMMMGTLNYMSPEQVRGERADQQSDVFSMGVVLYELFGGRRAFEGDSAASTLYKILQEVPEALWKVDAAVPRELTAIIDHSLGKLRDERYPDMSSLRRDLETLRNMTHLAGPSTPWPSTMPTMLSPRSDGTQPIIQTGTPQPGPGATPVPASVPPAQGGTTRGFLVGATIGALALAVVVLWMSNRRSQVAPGGEPPRTASLTPNTVPPPSTADSTVRRSPDVAETARDEKPAAGGDDGAPRSSEPRTASGRPASRKREAPETGATPSVARGREKAPPSPAEATPPPAPVSTVPPTTQPTTTAPPPTTIPPLPPAAAGQPGAGQTAAVQPPVQTPPAPSTVPPPPPLTVDRANELLGRYRAALQARSLEQLKRIWPSLEGNAEEAMRQQFAQASGISVETSEPQVSSSGSNGRITFVRHYSVVTVEGKRLQSTSEATMDVHRTGDAWVIDAIRFVSR